jgi:predicted TIM-barrel fold metal-dependent hydrolase
MQIIDAHHHLWDLERNAYPWLTPSTRHPAGDLTPICRSYRVENFLADAKNQDLAASVHLQAVMADPLAETAWLQQVANDPASNGFPQAIVAWADLADPAVEATLERQCAHPNLRGIRFMLNHLPDQPLYSFTDRPDWLTDPGWQQGFALLEKYHLSFDLQIYPHQMPAAAALATHHPNTQLLLNHTGLPIHRDAAYLDSWRQHMRTLAQQPNIATKISGLGMFEPAWTPASIRPLVLTTIDLFGPDRCLFASNFPIDKLGSSYDAIWQAFDEITADFPEGERRKLFHDNAAHFYRLGRWATAPE